MIGGEEEKKVIRNKSDYQGKTFWGEGKERYSEDADYRKITVFWIVIMVL